MNLKQLIVTIGLTGICTLTFVVGIYLLVLSKEKWEGFIASLVSVRDLEVSTSNFVALKVFGTVLILSSMALVFFFFIYSPEAA